MSIWEPTLSPSSFVCPFNHSSVLTSTATFSPLLRDLEPSAYMRLHQSLLLAVACCLLGVSAVEEDEVQLQQLTEDNFRASTSQGLW